jgi:hypothetical protein
MISLLCRFPSCPTVGLHRRSTVLDGSPDVRDDGSVAWPGESSQPFERAISYKYWTISKTEEILRANPKKSRPVYDREMSLLILIISFSNRSFRIVGTMILKLCDFKCRYHHFLSNLRKHRQFHFFMTRSRSSLFTKGRVRYLFERNDFERPMTWFLLATKFI